LRFHEVDVLGVYVAPIVLFMLAAWLVLVVVRRFAARFGFLLLPWHPALFEFNIYIIVLSLLVLAAAP
jgi:protein AaeX